MTTSVKTALMPGDWPQFSKEGYGCDRPDYDMPFERSAAGLIQPNATVLEIGCGIGRFVDRAFRKGAGRIVAVEPRMEMREKLLSWSSATAKADRLGRFEFIKGAWPCVCQDMEQRRFDLVFSQSSLHYLENEARLEAFTRIRHLMNRDGVFALTVRSLDCSWYERGELREVGPSRWLCKDGRVRTFFTLDGLVRELEQAGFPIRDDDCHARPIDGYGRQDDKDIWLEIIARVTE